MGKRHLYALFEVMPVRYFKSFDTQYRSVPDLSTNINCMLFVKNLKTVKSTPLIQNKMESTEKINPVSPECEIVSTRIFNYSRELVFNAWTDPDRLKNWWGPKGFTNTFHEFDLRPGGKWSFIMHGPDGVNYPNESVFVEIIEPELLIWNHLSNPKFQFNVTFEELPEFETKIIFKMIFGTPEECKNVKIYAVEKNEENFDRLEAELRKDEFLYV